MKQRIENLASAPIGSPTDTTDGGTLIDRLREEADKAKQAIADYLGEYDNPVPDYTLRRRYREAMRAVIEGDRNGRD